MLRNRKATKLPIPVECGQRTATDYDTLNKTLTAVPIIVFQ